MKRALVAYALACAVVCALTLAVGVVRARRVRRERMRSRAAQEKRG
jgi:hypothetical protein